MINHAMGTGQDSETPLTDYSILWISYLIILIHILLFEYLSLTVTLLPRKRMQKQNWKIQNELPKYKVEVYPKPRGGINSYKRTWGLPFTLISCNNERVWINQVEAADTLRCLVLHLINHRPSGLFSSFVLF